jgi:hypothetical protein
LLLCARDLGWIDFRIPMRHRQTEKSWANQFGFQAASIMWGFDIGTGLSTWVNYGGLWAIIGVMLADGSMKYGAIVMGSYWFGRALSLWLVPWVSAPRWSDSVVLVKKVMSQNSMYRRISVVGLVYTAVIELLILGSGR